MPVQSTTRLVQNCQPHTLHTSGKPRTIQVGAGEPMKSRLLRTCMSLIDLIWLRHLAYDSNLRPRRFHPLHKAVTNTARIRIARTANTCLQQTAVSSDLAKSSIAATRNAKNKICSGVQEA